MSDNFKPVVFLDTNIVNSSSINFFLGKINELEKIAPEVDFVLPWVVYDEIVQHKKHYFEEKQQELKKNPLLPMLIGPCPSCETISFDERITELEAQCPVNFSIASLSKKEEAFDLIYSLAIHNEAPFHKGSDKGFKDACIVCTILEYADNHPELDSILLVSSDTRLNDYFNKSTKVKTFLTLEELHDYVEKLAEQPCVEIDYLDSIEAKASGTLDELVQSFCSSPSFRATHSLISSIMRTKERMTDNQAMRVLRAAANNQQINWVLADDDVKEFVLPIFDQYQELLDEHDYRSIVDAAGLPNDRVDEFGNVSLSRSEKEAYDSFIDGLVSHIKSRDFMTSIATDYQEIEDALRNLLAKGEIDNNALNWEKVASCFIKDGSVIASNSPVNITPIKQFMRLMASSSIVSRIVV